MYNPSTRLLTILEMLQARGRMSGPELAARLEISPRSVRRYILMLQDMGIPIEGERGRYGQYRLRSSYRVPPLMFSDDEALALTAGLLLLRRTGGLVEAATAEGAFAKLDRVLPESVREQVGALEAALVLEPPRVLEPEPGPILDKIALLSRGVKERRRVWLAYGTQRRTEREFDPYAVVQRGNLWNVVGYCHLRGDVRIFRVDRIRELSLRDQTFMPPEPFDALEYVNRAFATIPSSYSAEILLRTDLETARREAFPALVTLEEREGGILMSCTTDALGWLVRTLAGFSFDWTVLAPTELKDVLLEHAATLTRRASL